MYIKEDFKLLSEDDEKKYLLSLVHDFCTFLPKFSEKLNSPFHNASDCATIKASIDSFEKAKAEIFSILKNDISLFEESDLYSMRVNGKKLFIRKDACPKDVHIVHDRESASYKIDGFPLRTNVLFNDKDFEITETPVVPKKEEIKTEPVQSQTKSPIVSKENIQTKKKTSVDPNEIHPKDLIMNAYQIDYPEENEEKKTMTVVLVPLVYPKNNMLSAPIMAVAKKDGKIATAASDQERKTSILLSVGNESVTAKGSWVDNRFKTFLYPQKTSGREIKITRKEYCPASAVSIGHFLYLDGMSEIHIFPMATQNNESGFVQFLACLRIKQETGFRSVAVVSPDGGNCKLKDYRISAKWINGILDVEIKKEEI